MTTLASYLKEISERVDAVRETILKKYLLKKYARQFFVDAGPDLEEFKKECISMHEHFIKQYPQEVQDFFNINPFDNSTIDMNKEVS